MNKWKFSLETGLSYAVFIHDLDFFIFSSNPVTIPNIYQQVKGGKKSLYIAGVRHVKLNTPLQPCEASEGYSFTACVRKSVVRKVGCRYYDI